MRNTLVNILEQEGPLLSSSLSQLLTEREGITAAAARQRVSRGSHGVRSLKGIKFPRNARFVFLEKDFGSERYWSRLIYELQQSRSIYGHALNCLKQRDGILPRKHFSIACGAPKRQKKHLAPDRILEGLLEANLVQVREVEAVGECIIIVERDNDYESQCNLMRSRLITEHILLQAIREWIRNLGFASFKLIKIRDESIQQPSVSTIEWDLAGPSYLGALVTTSAGEKPKPGFIACDVYLGGEVTIEGVRPFIHKCETLRGLKKVGRCLQIFVAERFDSDAYELAKTKGVVPATIRNLFGKDVAKAFKQLMEGLCNLTKLCSDPEKLNEIFNRLNAIEGASNNLRGALFAMISAEVSRRVLGVTIFATGKVFVKDGKKIAEVDIIATSYRNEVHFIECKGYQPHGTIDPEDIEIWLGERLPYLYNYTREHPDWKQYRCHFHYWISSQFSEESIAKLKGAASRTKRYNIEYLDGSAFLDFAKETKDQDIIKILSEHYTNNQYVQAVQSVERKKRKEAGDAKFRESTTYG